MQFRSRDVQKIKEYECNHFITKLNPQEAKIKAQQLNPEQRRPSSRCITGSSYCFVFPTPSQHEKKQRLTCSTGWKHDLTPDNRTGRVDPSLDVMFGVKAAPESAGEVLKDPPS